MSFRQRGRGDTIILAAKLCTIIYSGVSFTIPDLAAQLEVSKRTIRRWIVAFELTGTPLQVETSRGYSGRIQPTKFKLMVRK